MRDYFLMKRIKKREARIKLLFWSCFIVIGFIFVFGFDFNLKNIVSKIVIMLNKKWMNI